jgi:hypothetical protein
MNEFEKIEKRAREISPMAFNFGDWPIQIERELDAQREQARAQARAELDTEPAN